MNRSGDKDNKRPGFLISLFRSSIILSSIDRFTSYIYSLIKNGLFGFLFTGYKNDSHSTISDKFKSTKLSRHLGELRYGICRHIEQSAFVNLILRFTEFLLKCRLKVYGTFLVSFGAFNLITKSFSSIIGNNAFSLINKKEIWFALILVIASLPLLFSRKNLSEGLVSSFVGRFILKIIGFNPDTTKSFNDSAGYSSVAFLLGIAVSLATYSVNPVYVIGGLAAAVWAYIVLIRPEVGVLSMFFLMPFLPTMVLAAIVIFTFISWCIKLLRSKRKIRFEPIDIVVIAFALMLFSGGIISLSPESLKPALLMICLLMGYFLTVQLITTREWLVRCSVSSVISATLVSLYGILTYYTGQGYFSAAWLDDEMFNGIQNRAVSTLENPNMLGEYLILIIPIALVMLIGKGEGLRRLPAFFCLGIMGVCLLLTWSRGAWLALIIALVVFLLMWHHRSIWLIIAGVLSIPILPSILPASIISRFTSIGNMSDSSTSYRVYIWRAAVNMLGDNYISGIGIGEGAWRRMYPLYSYMGIEVAPHSHNLFIQLWLELGIFGILAFLVFVFLLLSSAFTMFSKLGSNSPLKITDLSESMMISNNSRRRGNIESQKMSRVQLRLSVIGPMTGIIAVLVQGLTDYSWYNYRLYLMFWLVSGLCIGYVRNGREYLSDEKEETKDELSVDGNFYLKRKKKKSSVRGEAEK